MIYVAHVRDRLCPNFPSLFKIFHTCSSAKTHFLMQEIPLINPSDTHYHRWICCHFPQIHSNIQTHGMCTHSHMHLPSHHHFQATYENHQSEKIQNFIKNQGQCHNETNIWIRIKWVSQLESLSIFQNLSLIVLCTLCFCVFVCVFTSFSKLGFPRFFMDTFFFCNIHNR